MVVKFIIDSINAITVIISNTIKTIPDTTMILLSSLSFIFAQKRNKIGIKTDKINNAVITDYFTFL